MKKLSILLSTLVLAAMLLTACGAEEPNTTPGAGLSTATLDATEAPDTTGTETPAAGAGTTTPGIPVTGGEEDPSRLSNLLDFGVWNQNGEQVGDVDDMILDLDDTRISYVIVGVGGFLGLGEKDVLIPWDSLRLGAVDAVGGQQNGFIYEGDPERFTNSPDWDVNDLLPEMGEPAGDWDADIRNFWESGALPATPDPNATATTQPEVTATPTPDAGQGQAVGQAEDLQGVMLASDVLGSTITLNQGQGQNQDQVPAVTTTGTPAAPGLATSTPDIGQGQFDPGRDQINATVDDLIVDPETGEILYIVIDALFDEERWIPVPLGFLQWDPTNEAFVVKVNMTALQNAPFFQDGQFPDTSVEGWNDEFDAFWANPDAGTGTQATPTP